MVNSSILKICQKLYLDGREMSMKKVLVLTLIGMFISFLTIFADSISLNDFNLVLPQNGQQSSFSSSLVVQTKKITNGMVVKSKTLNDGVACANKNLVEDQNSIGAEIITVKSGIGFLAKGTAIYGNYENRDAMLIDKKIAYNKAYLDALQNLGKFLNGMSVESKEEITKSMDMIINSNETLSNVFERYKKDFKGFGEAFLRGVVVYSVFDDVKTNTVTVTIVTTPKTVAESRAESFGMIESNTIKDGLKYVFRDINTHIIPPIGGKVVVVPSNGLTAIVTFGSAIRSSSNDRMKRAYEDEMLREMAKNEADKCMVAFLQGSEIAWTTGTTNTEKYKNDDFKKMYDTTNNSPKIVKDNIKKFQYELQQSNAYSYVVKGHLPPGVQSKVFHDENWWYVIDIYLPTLSQNVENLYKEMQGGSGTSGRNNNGTVQQGPSGQVSDNGNL